MIQVVPPLPWHKQTKPAVDDIEAVEAEVVLDKAQDVMVADDRHQAGRTDAIDAAVAGISAQHPLMMLTAMEKKRILR